MERCHLIGAAAEADGIALYRRDGFREVGTYREQGLLDGRRVDVLVMEWLLSRSSLRRA